VHPKKDEDFCSFEKALEELKLKETELRRLVSEGDIRAFRDEDTMKFRREDVERLKKDKGGDTGSLDFDLESDDASSDTLAEDLVFEEDDLGLDDEVGMATAQIGDSGFGDDLDLGDEDDALASSSSQSIRRTTGRGSQIRARAEEMKKANPVFVAMMVLSAVVLFYGVFVSISLFSDRTNGVTQGVAEFFDGVFGG
jgi:hypothetical protein